MIFKKYKLFNLLFMIFMLFFPSCKQQKKIGVNLIKSSPEKINEIKNHSDIPLPLNFHLASKSNSIKNDETSYITSNFHYTGNLPLKDIANFYLSNMEQFGWIINNLSTDEEVLLYCSKNRKYCAISARKNLNNSKIKTSIYIFYKLSAEQENKNLKNTDDEIDLINSKKISHKNICPSGYLC